MELLLFVTLTFLATHAVGVLGASDETVVLSGLLMVMDVDYNPGAGSSANPAKSRDTHYMLDSDDGRVWPLRFSDGDQPPERYGSGLPVEIEVLRSEITAASAPASTGARRSLALGAGTGGEAALPSTKQQTKPLQATTRHRRMGPADLAGPQSQPQLRQHDGEAPGTATTTTRTTAAGESTRPGGDDASAQLPLPAAVLEEEEDTEGWSLTGHRPRSGSQQRRRRGLAARRGARVRRPVRSDGRLTVREWRIQGDAELSDPYGDAYYSSSSNTRDGMLIGPGFSGGLADAAPYEEDQRVMMDDVSTVIFILDMCGQGPAATAEELKQLLFDPADGLEAYMSACSYHQTRFMLDENVKIYGPVPMDCSGTTDGLQWRATACQENDYLGWQFFAEKWARDNGIDISGFRHRVVVTSANKTAWMHDGDTLCDWSGIGTIGPAGSDNGNVVRGPYMTYLPGVFSYTWISGDHWSSPQAWIHELAHNYYLRHAGMHDCMYCDDSCAMGYCCGTRCFNAPHTWQLGWDNPVALVTRDSALLGFHYPYSLQAPPPGSGTVSQPFLRINTSWQADYDGTRRNDSTSVWVSYRQGWQPFDILPDNLTNNILIHFYPGEGPTDASLTLLVASLYPGEIWRNTTLGLAVMWSGVGMSGGASRADIRICWFQLLTETRCRDGLDDDCDGLIDRDDTADCADAVDYDSTDSFDQSPPPPPDQPPPPPEAPPPPPPPPDAPPPPPPQPDAPARPPPPPPSILSPSVPPASPDGMTTRDTIAAPSKQPGRPPHSPNSPQGGGGGGGDNSDGDDEDSNTPAATPAHQPTRPPHAPRPSQASENPDGDNSGKPVSPDAPPPPLSPAPPPQHPAGSPEGQGRSPAQPEAQPDLAPPQVPDFGPATPPAPEGLPLAPWQLPQGPASFPPPPSPVYPFTPGGPGLLSPPVYPRVVPPGGPATTTLAPPPSPPPMSGPRAPNPSDLSPPPPQGSQGLCLTASWDEVCQHVTPPFTSCPDPSSAATSITPPLSVCELVALDIPLSATLFNLYGGGGGCNQLRSPSGRYRLVLQPDGDLSLYDLQEDSTPVLIWSSGTGVDATAGAAGANGDVEDGPDPWVRQAAPAVLRLEANGTLSLVRFARATSVLSADGLRRQLTESVAVSSASDSWVEVEAETEAGAESAAAPLSPLPPGLPTSPGAPGIPGAPTPPGAPGAPTPPGIPGAPTTPGIPGALTPPGAPGAPTTPGAPGAPTTPGAPGAPTTPGAPGAPTTPWAPGAPTTPGAPDAEKSEAGPSSDAWVEMEVVSSAWPAALGGVLFADQLGEALGPFSLSVRDDGVAYITNVRGEVAWATAERTGGDSAPGYPICSWQQLPSPTPSHTSPSLSPDPLGLGLYPPPLAPPRLQPTDQHFGLTHPPPAYGGFPAADTAALGQDSVVLGSQQGREGIPPVDGATPAQSPQLAPGDGEGVDGLPAADSEPSPSPSPDPETAPDLGPGSAGSVGLPVMDQDASASASAMLEGIPATDQGAPSPSPSPKPGPEGSEGLNEVDGGASATALELGSEGSQDRPPAGEVAPAPAPAPASSYEPGSEGSEAAGQLAT